MASVNHEGESNNPIVGDACGTDCCEDDDTSTMDATGTTQQEEGSNTATLQMHQHPSKTLKAHAPRAIPRDSKLHTTTAACDFHGMRPHYMCNGSDRDLQPHHHQQQQQQQKQCSQDEQSFDDTLHSSASDTLFKTASCSNTSSISESCLLQRFPAMPQFGSGTTATNITSGDTTGSVTSTVLGGSESDYAQHFTSKHRNSRLLSACPNTGPEPECYQSDRRQNTNHCTNEHLPGEYLLLSALDQATSTSSGKTPRNRSSSSRVPFHQIGGPTQQFFPPSSTPTQTPPGSISSSLKSLPAPAKLPPPRKHLPSRTTANTANKSAGSSDKGVADDDGSWSFLSSLHELDEAAPHSGLR